MERSAARRAATLILLCAGAAAASVVVSVPPLRRIAAVAIRRWLGAGVPTFLLAEVIRAWRESGREVRNQRFSAVRSDGRAARQETDPR